MRHCIGGIFERVRKALRHGPGPIARPVSGVSLVQPYVVAHEQRQVLRPGGLPRVELLCAPHGMVVIR
jgi:hypothetical protein